MFTDSKLLSGYKPGKRCISIENGIFLIDTGLHENNHICKILKKQFESTCMPFVHIYGSNIFQTENIQLSTMNILLLVKNIYIVDSELFMELSINEPEGFIYDAVCDYLMNGNWNIVYTSVQHDDTIIDISIGRYKNFD